MSQWHSGPVDFLRRRLPSDSVIRPYAKRIVEDVRSLARAGRSWSQQEETTPAWLTLETTNICNADCVFCAYRHQAGFRKGQGVMQDDIFEKALREYKAMGGEMINFTPLVGDPLIDPNITRRIRRAKDEGFRVRLYTNGILFHRMDLEQFLDAQPDIVVISTSPFDRESHERIYQTRKYPELLDGVHRLLRLRNERGSDVKVGIQFRAHIPLDQILEQPDFRRYIQPYLRESEIGELYAQVKSFDHWGGLISRDDLVEGMSIAVPPLLKKRPCRWTFFMMVMYDGRVRACSCRYSGTEVADGKDGLLIGDLRSSTLGELWHGPAIRQLRRSFGQSTMPTVCRSCTMYRAV